MSLVPAYNQCTSTNRTHGPPLAHGSCAPPVRASSQLTVGTPDANGQQANSVGSLLLNVLAGDPLTPADEADVAVELGDEELLAAVQRRWHDMVRTRRYLTGALGSRHKDEAPDTGRAA